MIETIVENPRAVEESTSKEDVKDRYDGLRYERTDRAKCDKGSTLTRLEGTSLDRGSVVSDIDDLDKMTISDYGSTTTGLTTPSIVEELIDKNSSSLVNSRWERLRGTRNDKTEDRN